MLADWPGSQSGRRVGTHEGTLYLLLISFFPSVLHELIHDSVPYFRRISELCSPLYTRRSKQSCYLRDSSVVVTNIRLPSNCTVTG